MNNIRCIVNGIIGVLCCITAVAAGVCPLDGYNVFTYADSGYLPDANLSITSGDTNDPFFRIPQAGVPGNSQLSASVLLGAETGDPLLNAFEASTDYANRDHRTSGGIEFNCRPIPLSIAARYRYVDTYSDRFDALWLKFARITGSKMYHSNKSISYERFAAAQWNGATMQVDATGNYFGRWHATPYYFSPLREEGYSVGGDVSVRLKRVKMDWSQHFVRSDWYYNHQTPVTFEDHFLRSDVSVYLGKHFYALFSGLYATALQPGISADVGVVRTDSQSNMGVSVTGFSNRKIGGEIFGALHVNGNVSCSLMVSHKYHQKTRPYEFKDNTMAVTYQPMAYARNSISVTATWNDTIRFPLKISGWLFHGDRILRESIDESSEPVIIRQTTDGGGVGTFAGVNGWWRMEGDHFTLSLRPALIVPFGKRDDIGFFIGKMAQFEVSWHSANDNPARASVNLSCNDRPSLSYLVVQPDGTYGRRMFTAPVNVALNMSCRLPFIFMPVHSFIKESAFFVAAGPLRFTNDGRYPFHPKGNDFGPEMYVGLEGSIR